jgi:hypothetical protein
MARDPLEVLVGTGTLYIAPQGTAFPANPTITPIAPWEDIGYSTVDSNGWTFVVDRTFEDVLVAEEVDPLRVLKTAQTISMRGVAAQASLEVMEIAFGGGSIADDTPAVGFRTYSPPASDAYTERSLLFRALAPPGDGTEFRDVQVQRAIATGAVEIGHGKAPTVSGVAMDFRFLLPSVGDIYNIVEDKV